MDGGTSELLTGSTQADRPARRIIVRNDDSRFSYALASASLERQASASLEAHGAAPDAGIGAARGTVSHNGSAPTSREYADPAAASAIADPRTPEPLAATAPGPKAKTPGAAAAAVPPSVQLAAAPASALAPAPAPIQSPQGLGARDAASGAKLTELVAKAARPPEATKAPTVEFAKILAARLERTSVFDIRLDPPELGRVEGRLSVDDDGKAVLSLSFDNRSAFDLFSRDQAALRQALVQSGLNFGGGDFVFAFTERAAEDPFLSNTGVPPAAAAQGYDPLFAASWSAGALDIRI